MHNKARVKIFVVEPDYLHMGSAKKQPTPKASAELYGKHQTMLIGEV